MTSHPEVTAVFRSTMTQTHLVAVYEVYIQTYNSFERTFKKKKNYGAFGRQIVYNKLKLKIELKFRTKGNVRDHW